MSTMKTLPMELRPYERCLKSGPAVLNDAELLAVILRTGTTGMTAVDMTTSLLSLAGEQGLGFLSNASVSQLTKIQGIGEVKAVQLQCIGELAKRIARNTARPLLDLNNPATIADYYMEEMKYLNREQIRVMFLDTKFGFIRDMILAQGTINASVITPREIFLEALRYEAVHLILVHNHPSGDASPSKEDFAMTKRVKQSGSLLGIELSDHIIIGMNHYYSFAEHHAL